MLGIIKRNFIYLSEDVFVSPYKTLFRSDLEFCLEPLYRMGLIILRESPNEGHQVIIKLKHLVQRKTREIKITNITIQYTRGHDWGLQNFNGEILQSVNLELELHREYVLLEDTSWSCMVNSRRHYIWFKKIFLRSQSS